MTMRAKFPGRCKVCGQTIRVGEEIEWTKESGAKHVRCPQAQEKAPAAASAPVALVAGGARRESGTNRKSGHCERCGAWLQAGKGRLQYCEYDTGCPKHHDTSGYHLYCLDAEACGKAAAEARQQRAAEKAAAEVVGKLVAYNWDQAHKEQAQKAECVPAEIVHGACDAKVGCRSGTYGCVDHGTVYVSGPDVWTLEDAGDWGLVTRHYPGLAAEYMELLAAVPAKKRTATGLVFGRAAEVTITRRG